MKKSEESPKDLWDTIKKNNTHIVVFLEEEEGEREKGRKQSWRNNGRKLPKYREGINIQIQKIQRIPTEVNPKASTLRYIIIKLL